MAQINGRHIRRRNVLYGNRDGRCIGICRSVVRLVREAVCAMEIRIRRIRERTVRL